MSKNYYGINSLFQAPTGVNNIQDEGEVLMDTEANIDFINGINNGLSSINNLTNEDIELIKEGKKIEVDEELAKDMTEEEKEEIENKNFIENSEIPFLTKVNEGSFISAERDIRIERNKRRLKEPVRIRDPKSRSAYDIIGELYDYKDKDLKGHKLDLFCKYKDMIDFLLQAIEYMHIEKKIDCYLGISLGILYLKDLIDREVMDDDVYIELIDDIKYYINKSLEFNNIDTNEIEIPDTIKVIKATTGVREAKNEGQLRINSLIKPMKSIDEIIYKSAIIGMIQSIHDAEELSASEVINLIEEIEYENMNSKRGVFNTLSKILERVKDDTIAQRIGLMVGDYVLRQPWLTCEQRKQIMSSIIPYIENGEIEKSLKARGENWKDYLKGYLIAIYHGSNPCILDDYVLLSDNNVPLINAKDIKILDDMGKVFKRICKASEIEIKDFEMFK